MAYGMGKLPAGNPLSAHSGLSKQRRHAADWCNLTTDMTDPSLAVVLSKAIAFTLPLVMCKKLASVTPQQQNTHTTAECS